ncbi:MAG: hypothetical protein KC561_02840 [Myxococcales bacterium]|nr:hypothetical protein [Myxococcales bacterium]
MNARPVGLFIFTALVFFAQVASSQPSHVSPSTGRVRLRDGGEVTESGTYGGNTAAATFGSGCVGYVASEPSFALRVTADGWVRISVEAGEEGADTTMVLSGDAGAICNDDVAEGNLNPEIYTFLAAGRYQIYVGGYAPGERGEYAIHFSHSGHSVLPELTGESGLSLYGYSGGAVAAADMGDGCIGRISDEPNHTLRLDRPTRLDLQAESASDLTLVVETNQGVFCNDDGFGSLNPRIDQWFDEGLVRVFVGSHNPSVVAPYTLTVQPRSGD